MTEIIRRKILGKLENLTKYLKYLSQIIKESETKKKFLTDFHLFGTAERYLQLACQTVIDTLDLIVIEEDLEKPGNRSEQISLIYNQRIISEKMASELDEIVKFRNIIVHEYGEIDKEKVYKFLKEKIEIFKLFRKEILGWLKSNKG
jgi:uncharacterized protein YutE (UPF0331/DUF86 family)